MRVFSRLAPFALAASLAGGASAAEITAEVGVRVSRTLSPEEALEKECAALLTRISIPLGDHIEVGDLAVQAAARLPAKERTEAFAAIRARVAAIRDSLDGASEPQIQADRLRAARLLVADAEKWCALSLSKESYLPSSLEKQIAAARSALGDAEK